jgi:hypothetical protein
MRSVFAMVAYLHNYRRWLVALVLVNALDLILTWILLVGGGAYEANPLAARILDNFGWTGLAGLKLVSVALVLGVTVIVNGRHPIIARRLLKADCVVMTAVVAYSCLLFFQGRGSAEAAELEKAQRQAVLIEHQAAAERRWRQWRTYLQEVDQAAHEVMGDKLSLTRAVERLMPAFHVLAAEHPLASLPDNVPALSDEGRVAAHIMNSVLHSTHNHPASKSLWLAGLQSEFLARYGQSAHMALLRFTHDKVFSATGLPRPAAPSRVAMSMSL